MNWNYIQPVNIMFGQGRTKELSNLIEDKQVLWITSHSLRRKDIFKKLFDVNGSVKYIYDEVRPNPDIADCFQCIDTYRDEVFDFIIAVGGGSVIDFAKIVSVLLMNREVEEEILFSNGKLPLGHLDVIAIPTTAGTGSEVSNVAVISSHERGIKKPICSDAFYPKIAIVDPEWTYSLPQSISACSGFDVLCHAIEAYWSKNHQPICDTLAIHAIQLVIQNLEIVYKEPENHLAREKMMEASLMAGLAFNHTKTTAIHACSYPLSNLLEIPHGEACALTLCYFLQLGEEQNLKRLSELVHLCGFNQVQGMIHKIENMRKTMHILNDLKKYNIDQTLFDQIIKDSQNPNLLNHPFEITQQELIKMFKQLI